MRRRLAISVGGLAVLLAALDAYVVVSILVTILNDLQLPVNHLERATPIITAYLLGYVAAMPLMARVSDRFGRRIVIYICLAGFAAGSVITAQAHSLNWLAGGRAAQGLAGGALLPVTLALVADLFTERSRATALGAVGAAQELGSVLGPLYGIGLAALVGWRGIFWINIPLAVLAAVAVHFAVPGGRTQGGERPRVDVVGGLLIAFGLAALVIALYNQDPEKSVLPSWGPAMLGVGGALVLAFVLWEWKARTKLLDMRTVRKAPFFASLIASAFAGAALFATLIFIQLDAQLALNLSAAKATLILVRFLAALPVGAIVGGYLVRRLGERWVSFFGLVIAACGYLLIARWPVHVLSSVHDLGFRQGLGGGHRPDHRRPRAGSGDRAAVLRGAAGDAGDFARHRLGRRRGGAHDGHAARRVRAGRLGPAPVPGADSGRGPATRYRAVRRGAAGVGRQVQRRDRRRAADRISGDLPGHRRSVRARCTDQPVAAEGGAGRSRTRA